MKTTFNKPGFKMLLIALAGIFVLFSCTKEKIITPAVNKIEPGEAAVNTTLTLTGSGLRNIKSIVFDLGNVPVSFNSNFNTDNAIIFRVPAEANAGDQHIVFTNTSGYQFSVPFKVLPLAVVSSAFPGEWEADNLITLTGNYFETVDEVVLEASGQPATIVSKTATTLVIRMPASTVPSTKLILHNNAGSGITNQVFINLDQQQKLYTEAFGPSIENWSWCTATGSPDFFVSGTSALKAVYAAGGWQGLSFRRATPFVMNSFQSLSFWVKGGTLENQVDIKPDAVSAGTAGTKTITIPPGQWKYFNIPISGNFEGVTCERLNFQIHGADQDQTLYFDNVVFIK